MEDVQGQLLSLEREHAGYERHQAQREIEKRVKAILLENALVNPMKEVAVNVANTINDESKQEDSSMANAMRDDDVDVEERERRRKLDEQFARIRW